MWVRGLKQSGLCDYIGGFSSHPVWVRGLKQDNLFTSIQVFKVAPRVGAWIETLDNALKVLSVGRTPCGCVD